MSDKHYNALPEGYEKPINWQVTSKQEVDRARIIELKAERDEAVELLKYALADLEGVMEQIEPDGQRQHSGWKTISEISTLLNKISV